MEESVEEFGALFARFLRMVVEDAPLPESALSQRLRAHLGTDPLGLPLTGAALAPFEHADLQMAFDAYTTAEGRGVEVIGLGGHGGMGLEDVLVHSRGPVVAPSYAERPVDVDRQMPCLRKGILLVTDPHAGPHAIVVSTTDHGPFESLQLGVLTPAREHGAAVHDELRRLMTARSVYRRKVLTLTAPDGSFGGHGAGARFLPRQEVERDAIVLPEGLLERIERRTVGFDRVVDRLAAQGLSRKRGVLLYGPPGTGKTLTVQHLVGRMTDRTVVVLTGQALGVIAGAASLARRLQPAMLVLEDVDLVAHDRSFDPMGNPVLFELLNALDGLGQDDADVVVLLTTNRADLLEPALAARPGRVDLAVELPLPDEADRARLLDLYASGVPHDVDDWGPAVARTAGTPASFMSELVRSAALAAADRGAEVVTAGDVEAALDELLDSGPLTAALLGARWSGQEDAGPGPAGMGGPPVVTRSVMFRTPGPEHGHLTEEP